MTIPDPDERKALFIDPDTLFSRATDQVSADLSGDMAILNLQSKTYFGLTGVGAFIWQKLEIPTTFLDLCRAVEYEFEVSLSQCEADIDPFISRLAELGLIKLTPCREVKGQGRV